MNARGACRPLMYGSVPLRDTSRKLLGNTAWLARLQSEKALKQVDRRLVKGSRREPRKIRADITKGIHTLTLKESDVWMFPSNLDTWNVLIHQI